MIGRLFKFIFRAALSALFISAAWIIWLPDVMPLATEPPKTTAYIELRRSEARRQKQTLAVRRVWTPYAAISKNLISAVVVAEDDGYWRHGGVDWEAIRVAFDRDVTEKKISAGGSTIAMQLARNLYLSPARNPLRKLKEMLIAERLEKKLGRRRVLELYLNVIEWGPGIFGCEAAARAYFAKSCSELKPDEAVAMAVVLPNPRRWNPAKRGPYVERNSARVIARMDTAGIWPGADATVSTSTVAP